MDLKVSLTSEAWSIYDPLLSPTSSFHCSVADLPGCVTMVDLQGASVWLDCLWHTVLLESPTAPPLKLGATASSCRHLLLKTRCFCLVPYWAQWSRRPSDRDNQSDDNARGRRIIALGLWSWGIQGRPPVGRAESQGQSPSGDLFCLYQGCCSYNNRNKIFWCWAHA